MTTPEGPARHPLLVHGTGHYVTASGSTVYTMGWRTLYPDDPDYETEFQNAVQAHRLYGTTMPYAPDQGEKSPHETAAGPQLDIPDAARSAAQTAESQIPDGATADQDTSPTRPESWDTGSMAEPDSPEQRTQVAGVPAEQTATEDAAMSPPPVPNVPDGTTLDIDARALSQAEEREVRHSDEQAPADQMVALEVAAADPGAGVSAAPGQQVQLLPTSLVQAIIEHAIQQATGPLIGELAASRGAIERLAGTVDHLVSQNTDLHALTHSQGAELSALREHLHALETPPPPAVAAVPASAPAQPSPPAVPEALPPDAAQRPTAASQEVDLLRERLRLLEQERQAWYATQEAADNEEPRSFWKFWRRR